MPNLEHLEPDKTLTWPDLVYTELICMVGADDRAGVWEIALQRHSRAAGQLDGRSQPLEGPLRTSSVSRRCYVYFDPWMAASSCPA